MIDEHISDLLSGLALDVLDNEEKERAARHLAGCAICQSELMEYRRTVDLMTQAAPVTEPSPGLKSRVVTRIAQAAGQRAVSPRLDLRRNNFWESFRFLVSSPMRAVAVGVFAVLFLVSGLSNLFLFQQINTLQARVPDNNVHVIRLDGNAASPQTVGYMMIFTNETAGTLAVQDAPLLDPGHQYQVWLIKGGKRTSGGVFSVNENGYGSMQITASQPLENFDAVGITVEPMGGSAAPSGSKILGGSL